MVLQLGVCIENLDGLRVESFFQALSFGWVTAEASVRPQQTEHFIVWV